ncbi:MAG: hypothetical protein C0603_10255 [Denitrovibrio sp.]|nr:MAG: hypothetical protein C0603_10255 [Denitrovibrio sp.]
MALAIIMLMAIYKVYRTRDYSVFKKFFFIFFIMMIIAETISTFAGVDPANSIKSYESFWVLSYLPAIYVVFAGRDKINYMIYVFLGTICASLYGIIELFYYNMSRADGFFSHSLTFGNVLALVVIAAIGVIVFKAYETKTHLNVTLITLLTSVPALMLSGSRGPILACLVSVFVMMVFKYRWKGLIPSIVVLLVIFFTISQIHSVKIRFVKTIGNISNTESSIGTRLVLWEASMKAIMARPVFGYGKRNFTSEVSKYINVPTSSRAHAHNTYIQYTFLHGFFGLSALLGFLGSVVWEIWRRRRSGPYLKIALFVVLVFLLEGLTENALGDSEIVIMCFSLIGLMLAPGRPAISIDDDLEEFTEPLQN